MVGAQPCGMQTSLLPAVSNLTITIVTTSAWRNQYAVLCPKLMTPTVQTAAENVALRRTTVSQTTAIALNSVQQDALAQVERSAIAKLTLFASLL